jgi:undecaprenyl-diphosphatase
MDPLIAALAQYGFIISFAAAFVVWLRLPRMGKLELLVAGVIGGVLCLLLIRVSGALFYDTRPFVTQHIAPLFPHASDNGFPSDHTAVTMFAALCVAFFSWRWGIVLAAVSLLCGAARVAAHVHSPVDIAGAVAIAAVAALAGRLLMHWALAHWSGLRRLGERGPREPAAAAADVTGEEAGRTE